ncbi:MAG: GNAT family N-acetyltransferase [Thermoflexales bacterium]
MTQSDIGFSRAIALVVRDGNALEQVELAYLLRGSALSEDARRALLTEQREDGGWTPPWIEANALNYSGIGATCLRLARAWACGFPADTPEIRSAVRFLVARQGGDGAFEEDISVAAVAPDWLKPGNPSARAYVTANAGFWLAMLGERGAAVRAEGALAREAGDADYAQTRWLRAALRWRLLGRERRDHDLDALGDALPGFDAGDLAWMLQTLMTAGLPAFSSVAEAGVARLIGLRGGFGAWERGGAPSVRLTLDALGALRASGLPLLGQGDYRVERVVGEDAIALIADLARLLLDAVDGGASVGYLPPLSRADALDYARAVAAAVLAGGRVLLVARADGRVIGTGQLDLALRANGLHRAEVAKVMTLSAWRGRGVGRSLMLALEDEARRLGRSTLVLDTRQGDSSEALYQSLGWVQVGVVQRYARSASGALHNTVFYYKLV